MVSSQFWPESLLQSVGNAVPMALVRQQLETGKGNALAFFPNPIRNFEQRGGLLGSVVRS